MKKSKSQKTAEYLAEEKEVDKCVLLYSGGLDTSVMLKWIQDNYNCELITVTLEVGQSDKNLEKVKQKALDLGATNAYIIDVREEFAEDYISKAIKANALYQGKYPLSTSIARPLQAKWGVKIAKKENADAIAHGSTGKGNDQVRFDVTIQTLTPEIKTIAPVREWNMTRDKELEYAKKHGIPVPKDNEEPYSIDENLWGKSSECGIIEHPDKEVPKEVLSWSRAPEEAPDEPEYVEIGFKNGVPTALDGKEMSLLKIIQILNEKGGKHGIGIIDHMEDRVVGLKSREFYECPAATIILEAHKDLEKFVSTKHINSFKPKVDQKWAELVYSGLWVDPLKTASEAFIDQVNKKVDGNVKLKLYKGSAKVVGRESKNALYDLNLATYEKSHTFNQKASPGFIELWGLQSKVANNLEEYD